MGLLCFFNQERSAGKSGISDLIDIGLTYRPYLKSYDMVMVPAGSPLAGKSVLTDKDIASKPLVTTNSFLRNVISQRFGSDAISFSSTDFALRKDLVVRGAAHSFLPAFSQITMAKEQDFVLRDMEHPWEVEIGFVGTEEALSAEAFQGLVRILDEFYRAHLDSGLYTLP